jgi:RimJ/RimL family protein N-acetyltransferase
MEKPRPAAAHVRLRPAAPSDAPLLQRWRAEPSVRLFQPLKDLTVGQLRSDVASQRLADLYRGRGEKFQWIIEVEGEAAGWLTLVVSNWEHGLAEVGYALTSRHQGQGAMTRALAILLEDVFTRTGLERIEARCALSNLGLAAGAREERLSARREAARLLPPARRAGGQLPLRGAQVGLAGAAGPLTPRSPSPGRSPSPSAARTAVRIARARACSASTPTWLTCAGTIAARQGHHQVAVVERQRRGERPVEAAEGHLADLEAEARDSAASVITTARVVLPSQACEKSGGRAARVALGADQASCRGSTRRPPGRRPGAAGPKGSRTSPKALTATAAATVGPPGTVSRGEAEAALHRALEPARLADRGAGAGPDAAHRHLRRRPPPPPRLRPARRSAGPRRVTEGEVEEDRRGHQRHGPPGAGGGPTTKPWPRPASQATPARPPPGRSALPPASTTACARLATWWPRTRESNCRVPVAEPRTSAAASAPSGQRITVTPVLPAGRCRGRGRIRGGEVESGRPGGLYRRKDSNDR